MICEADCVVNLQIKMDCQPDLIRMIRQVAKVLINS